MTISAESAPVELVEAKTPYLLPIPKKKLAIIGFAEGHINEAPFGQDEWELWGINRLHILEPAKDKTFNRWFNLHDLEKFHGKDQEHIEFLMGFDGPVYLRAQDIGKFPIPNAVPFPADELVKRFGGYFNNTISWLLAYAITLEPTDLGVFGVDMAQDQILQAEYSEQRPSCEFFLGLASGMGITLQIPKGSDLLRATHLYGFENADVFTEKLQSRLQEVGGRKEQAKAQLAQLQNQVNQVTAAINQLDGAMQDNQYWLRNWVPQPPGDEIQSSNGEVDV